MTPNDNILVEPASAAVSRPALTNPGPDFSRDVYCILGLPFDLVNLQQATARMHQAAKERRRCFLSTPNLNFVIACLKDRQFRSTVIQSNLSVIDGMPIVWIARALGLPFTERVSGSTLFDSLRMTAGKNGVDPMRIYFFGGLPGVGQQACEKINADNGGMLAVGYETPGFGSVEEMSTPETIRRINDSQPDLLVVALNAKKGQEWVQRNRDDLDVALMGHLGAVINFVAGTVSRAPRWVQKSGLEWAWRIKEEPALWRRYWNDGRTLLQLLAKVVLPGALAARRHSVSAAQYDAAQVDVRLETDRAQLVLGGAIGKPNIDRLRSALAQVWANRAPVVVDCSALSHVDSAALGALILLYGACAAAQRPWTMAGVSPVVRRQFELHCAQYLLEPLQ